MKLLTTLADVRCAHRTGRVWLSARQGLVHVDGAPVLARGAPVGDLVAFVVSPLGLRVPGCSNRGAAQIPCTAVSDVQGGYSTLVFIDGEPVVGDELTGSTNGMAGGGIRYQVLDPGQALVESER